jgi:hypothetical protein
MIPAAKQRVNGVRVGVVAMLVAGKVTACTPEEYRIALKVQRVGERLERKGWLPELRRRAMLRKIVLEAKQVRVSPQAGGSQPDGDACSEAPAERPAEPAHNTGAGG